jgi:protein gp37
MFCWNWPMKVRTHDGGKDGGVMAENSNIEWTDHTFNPWIGCQKVSPGCDHCYAETWDARGLQQRESRWGPHASRTRTSPANWRKPLAWDKAAKASGNRARVFCASLADVFDNHGSILPEWRADLWALIAETPHLDWLMLTKRPQNITKMLPGLGMELGWGTPAWGDGWPNVWLGTTVENQTEADRRIPHLLSVPAKVRFLSCEPMLGPIDLTALSRPAGLGTHEYSALDCDVDPEDDGDWHGATINWVICGGESGPAARPMHPDWARSLRDQCDFAGVPFHFKQWGEFAPHPSPMADGAVYRVGKNVAGRLLDGIEWNDLPEGGE